MDADTFLHLHRARANELQADADHERLVRQILRSRPPRPGIRARLGGWLIGLGERISPETVRPTPGMARKVA